jgi:hypothetical protein
MTTGTWRHRNCLDIDLYISRIINELPNSYIVWALVYNRFNGISYEFEQFEINKKDLYKWRKISDNML